MLTKTTDKGGNQVEQPAPLQQRRRRKQHHQKNGGEEGSTNKEGQLAPHQRRDTKQCGGPPSSSWAMLRAPPFDPLNWCFLVCSYFSVVLPSSSSSSFGWCCFPSPLVGLPFLFVLFLLSCMFKVQNVEPPPRRTREGKHHHPKEERRRQQHPGGPHQRRKRRPQHHPHVTSDILGNPIAPQRTTLLFQ